MAVAKILAALLEREKTGRGTHVVVSMTHGSHRFAAHRLTGEPTPKLLTGGLACYGIYETADGRHITVGALESKFFTRLCDLVGLPELAARQFDPSAQAEIASGLAGAFAAKPLADWLQLFDGEDVSVGPVATLAEAAADFGRGA
jgi:crotonobetainyl-CoA:carnitine CoA-transferase CaiB-like acyl-CoA transferase